MKNKKKIAMISLFFLFFLASCSQSETKVDTKKQAASASSSAQVSSTIKSSTDVTNDTTSNNYTADTKTVHGLNDPATISVDGKPAVTIEIIKASANPADIINQKNAIDYPLDSILRLDIRMTNHSVRDFNSDYGFYNNCEIHTDNRTFVFPSIQYQPEGEPETSPLAVGLTGVVESYYVLENKQKFSNIQEVNIDYYYIRNLVNANSQDFSSVKFKLPISH